MGKEKYDASMLKRRIIEILSASKKVEKKKLFSESLKIFSLTPAEKKDRSPGGKYIRCKSLVGSVLAEMLMDKTVEQPEEGYYVLSEKLSAKELITDEMLEECIREITENEVLTRKRIFSLCDEKFAGEKEVMHRRFGDVLARLVKSGELTKSKEGEYSAAKNKFPNTELGNVLKGAYEGKDLYKSFKKALNLKGGEFFEELSVKLLTEEIAKNGKVSKSEVTGGTTDNGIDGVIEFVDGLGFSERVLIQARTRSNGSITLKEVREFFGALAAEKGTRGVYITTSSFHSEATKFINRQGNLVGINGDKLCRLAEDNGIGIVNKEIDYKLFLDE